MRIDSSAPTRIDLAGGTYDIWPLYLFHERAQTINIAISLRAHCHLSSRPDHRVFLVSEDTGEQVEAADPAAVGTDRLPLVARLVKHFGARGLEVRTRADSPVGAGIAGSSAMNIALIGALAAWTGRTMTDEDMLALAMNVEAQVIGVPTGAQDYRPALFGGVSAVELGVTGVRRTGIDVDPVALERRIVLAYTGASRQSGINNWEVMTRRINGETTVVTAFNGIRDSAEGVRHALERQQWSELARHVSTEWNYRKWLAPTVTTREIDAMLTAATKAGATAGKVCGAGGGGCLFCIVEPDRHAAVATAIAARGATILPFTVETNGLTVIRA